jgi:multidrug efflux pump subunit AcrA (membrane-fusion protein)
MNWVCACGIIHHEGLQLDPKSLALPVFTTRMSTEKQGLEGLRIDRTAVPARSSKAWLVVVALMLILAAGGILFWFQRPKPALVRTEAVRMTTTGGDHTLLNASGYVTARRQATISSKVTGKVTEVLVEEGMKVDADQILARLDSSNVEAGLKQAQAQLESMQRSLEETTPALDRAERELQRFTQLAGNEYVSKSELDRVETDARLLRAR